MEKILLIDGHSVLARAFYGIPGLTAGDGRPTNAVFGFLNILLKAIQDEKPDYITVAFDLNRQDLKRTQMYPAYKGTRKPMPEELHMQIPVMQELLKLMNVPVVTLKGYEADDLLGTMARQAEENGLKVTILSGDRDLLQLATDSTTIMLPKPSRRATEIKLYTPEKVKEEYEVTPAEFIDLKALMGDASDNIPGLPGIGEVTARKIITGYHSIENAKAHEEELPTEKIRKAFREHYDLAELSKKLATIDTKAPVTLDYKAGSATDIYTTAAVDMLRDLELKTLVNRFLENRVTPGTNISETAQNSEIQMPQFKTITDAFIAKTVFSDAASYEKIGMAVYASDFTEEAQQLSLFDDAESGFLAVALCLDENRHYLIKSGDQYPYGTLKQDLAELTGRLKEKETVVCFMDFKTAMHVIPQLYELNDFDASVAAYLLNPLRAPYTYDSVAKDVLHLVLKTPEELIPKKKDYSDEYLAIQAWTALKAETQLKKLLKEKGMEQLYYDVELPLIKTLFDMECAGIRVDAEKLEETGRALTEEAKQLEQEIYALAGMQFNINSPQQLGTILFEKLGIPGAKKTKTGYSTSADILEKLAEDYEIVRKILRYRTVTKLNSTYAEGLKAYISEDGRIHGSFNQTITATGRLSSSDPNLQNIPVRTEEGRQIRKVFVPAEGCTFVDADYSQVELRILAALSGDAELIRAYQNSSDIHRLTASKVFHVPPEEVTEQQRRNAKAVNFGIVYGISAYGLGEGLSISRKEAAAYIETYFKAYPGIKTYLDRQVRDAKEKGFVTTAYGRTRPVPELKSSAYMQRMFGERVAMNAPIQGSAADIMKKAMNGVAHRLKPMKSRLVLQIHDELLVEAVPEEVEEVKQILKEEMEGAAELSVKLVVDVKTGNDWNECH